MNIFRYRISATLRYVFLSLLLMSLLNLMASYNMPTHITLLFAGFYGLTIGVYRAYFDFRLFRKWTFLKRLILQVVVIQVLIMLIILLDRFILSKSELAFNSRELMQLLSADIYVDFYAKAQIFALTLLFFIELETILGKKFMYDYILGRYRKPVKESRILLFMDIKNSTAIAEELGDEMYYHFLNDCYTLLNNPVIITNARILKYIGDEVVISWKDKNGLQADLALEFYNLYKSAILKEADYFKKRYNRIPQFSTGIHIGDVVAAFIGDIKKQLDLNGDLMNTTSRISKACKKYNAELLISDGIYNTLESDSTLLKAESIGKVKLKGKKDKVLLYKINV